MYYLKCRNRIESKNSQVRNTNKGVLQKCEVLNSKK